MKTSAARISTKSYSAGAMLPAHRDAVSRISFIMAGECAEDSRFGSYRLRPGDVLFKSYRALHENRIAPVGLRLLTIEPIDDNQSALRSAIDRGEWVLGRNTDLLRSGVELLAAFHAECATSTDTLLADLAATQNPPDNHRAAPRWLAEIYGDLQEISLSEVCVKDRAERAGTHPVQASRLFRSCYGVSITDHAQYYALRRAISRLSEGDTVANAAQAAGFFDQSHLTRVMRDRLNVSPGRLRHVFHSKGR